MAPERIVLDPGFGFGKTLEQNIELFRSLPELVATGFPLLVGVSRKSMIGEITSRPVEDRLAGSVAAAVLAAKCGVAIVRVHDVSATVDALKVYTALSSSKA
jgi:dihydropteroate synthase